VETVRRHYFSFTYDEDDQIIYPWELPKKLPPATAQLVQPGSELTNWSNAVAVPAVTKPAEQKRANHYAAASSRQRARPRY
jgi:hypothetical protein